MIWQSHLQQQLARWRVCLLLMLYNLNHWSRHQRVQMELAPQTQRRVKKQPKLYYPQQEEGDINYCGGILSCTYTRTSSGTYYCCFRGLRLEYGWRAVMLQAVSIQSQVTFVAVNNYSPVECICLFHNRLGLIKNFVELRFYMLSTHRS